MKHITFQEFATKIASTIKSYLPEDYAAATVHIQKNVKPGDKVLTGISICRPNCNIAPILYLDDIYPRYCAGERFETLLQRLTRSIVEETKYVPDLQQYLKWDVAKDFVTSRLINHDRNAGYIANRPFIPVNESPIGVVFDIDLSGLTEQNMSIPITFSLMEHWGTTIADLDKASKANNPRLRPVFIRAMGQVLSDSFPGMEIPKIPDLFLIVTNENLSHGAITVTYAGVEEQLKQLLGEFYLIPSSIHEMLAVSRNMASPDALTGMVQEINDTQVAAEDVLDSTLYTLENGQLIPVQLEEQPFNKNTVPSSFIPVSAN